LRLPLGADCVARIEAKLANVVNVANELDRLRGVALSTAHDAAPGFASAGCRRSAAVLAG